jgi:uncharacterized protein
VGGVLEALSALAPPTAVRGNEDRGSWARELPETAALVTGHPHQRLVDERAGVLHLNPGSAGPRRFRLPVTVGRLEVAGGRLSAVIIPLALAPRE